MKIAVFGASGMLGSTLVKYAMLKGNFEIVPFARKPLPGELSRVEYRHFEVGDDLPSEKFHYVINCCGAVKQRNTDPHEMFQVNSEFPKKLAERFEKRMIHISTDCVFSGKKGLYVEDDAKDCDDDYGLSKSGGEDAKCRIIRTSIVGNHPTDNSGLLEWFRRNTNSSVFGYSDHFWGGVTTLRLSQFILDNLEKDYGLMHVYSDRTSKLQLLENFREVFDINIEIQQKDAGFLDRSLSTSLPENPSNGNVLKQLFELKEFERTKIW